MALDQTPEGLYLLPSAQKHANGTPRFTLSLPPSYNADPGLSLLAKLEAEHAGFEFTTRAFFDRHLQAGDIFFDVGAHFGLYAMGAATRLPGEVRVIGFEPHPMNVLSALRQLGHNRLQKSVEIVCSAVGAAPGFGKLWPFSTMGNFLSAERPADAFEDNPPLSVPILSLDMFVDQRADLAEGRILLKIDVEGFEPEVLAGADNLLASGRVAALILEKSDFYATPERAPVFQAMIERLEGHGYRIRWFPHLHMPSALIPWVNGNETGNLVALAPDFEADPIYDGPAVDYAGLPPPMQETFSATDKVLLTQKLIEAKATDGWRWANPKNTEDGTVLRASLAKPHIQSSDRVLDLGAGLMKPLFGMRMNNTYTPVDLVRFSKTTVLADLNDNGFPEGEWDCALALALLEHIHDVPALLTKVRSSCQRLICIYVCQEDVGEVEVRRANGFFNDFSRAELRGFFEAAGWRVAVSATEDVGTLFVCD